jgi:hypothetical protein
MGDAYDFFHTWRAQQSLQLALMLRAASDYADHGSFFATAQMRLATALSDTFDYVIDLFFCCALRHVDNHD